MVKRVELLPLRHFPLVEPGDDLASLLMRALDEEKLSLQQGDVLVLAQKIVSKAENRYRRLADVEPSEAAIALARDVDKDPRLCELILQESNSVVRKRQGVVIVEHKHGYVHANAGIDRSNIPAPEDEQVLLLPANPDASAASLLSRLETISGKQLGLIINDSAGRAWRNGTVGFALACAGFKPLVNMIGKRDLFGRVLEVTEVAVADELAAAASFIMGQAAEGIPVVLIRGAILEPAACGSAALIRDRQQDLFR